MSDESARAGGRFVPRGTGRLVLIAAGVAAGAGVCGGQAAVLGAVAAAMLQIAAFVLVARVPDPSGAQFLGAFALAAAVRLLGGTAAVLVAVATGAVETLVFVAGFGAAYVALEVAVDVWLVRSEGPRARAG